VSADSTTPLLKALESLIDLAAEASRDKEEVITSIGEGLITTLKVASLYIPSPFHFTENVIAVPT
jgi:hypothetical protein